MVKLVSDIFHFPFLNGGRVVVGFAVVGLKTGPAGVGAAGALTVSTGTEVRTHFANL